MTQKNSKEVTFYIDHTDWTESEILYVEQELLIVLNISHFILWHSLCHSCLLVRVLAEGHVFA